MEAFAAFRESADRAEVRRVVSTFSRTIQPAVPLRPGLSLERCSPLGLCHPVSCWRCDPSASSFSIWKGTLSSGRGTGEMTRPRHSLARLSLSQATSEAQPVGETPPTVSFGQTRAERATAAGVLFISGLELLLVAFSGTSEECCVFTENAEPALPSAVWL